MTVHGCVMCGILSGSGRLGNPRESEHRRGFQRETLAQPHTITSQPVQQVCYLHSQQ